MLFLHYEFATALHEWKNPAPKVPCVLNLFNGKMLKPSHIVSLTCGPNANDLKNILPNLPNFCASTSKRSVDVSRDTVIVIEESLDGAVCKNEQMLLLLFF